MRLDQLAQALAVLGLHGLPVSAAFDQQGRGHPVLVIRRPVHGATAGHVDGAQVRAPLKEQWQYVGVGAGREGSKPGGRAGAAQVGVGTGLQQQVHRFRASDPADANRGLQRRFACAVCTRLQAGLKQRAQGIQGGGILFEQANRGNQRPHRRSGRTGRRRCDLRPPHRARRWRPPGACCATGSGRPQLSADTPSRHAAPRESSALAATMSTGSAAIPMASARDRPGPAQVQQRHCAPAARAAGRIRRPTRPGCAKAWRPPAPARTRVRGLTFKSISRAKSIRLIVRSGNAVQQAQPCVTGRLEARQLGGEWPSGESLHASTLAGACIRLTSMRRVLGFVCCAQTGAGQVGRDRLAGLTEMPGAL